MKMYSTDYSFLSAMTLMDLTGVKEEDIHFNLFPEGYYYKPHYRVKIKSFDETVNEGNHYLVGITDSSLSEDNEWTITTDKNYFFQAATSGFEGSLVYLYEDTGNGYVLKTTGHCVNVTGRKYDVVMLAFEENVQTLDGCKLFKHNTEMPFYATDLRDGSGRYIWRDVESYSEMPVENELYNSQFTNGAHYFHENIMFYVKRQDPKGNYGIGREPADVASKFILDDEEKDVSVAESKFNFDLIKC